MYKRNMIIVWAFLAGFIAGLRTFIPLAMVSWAVFMGWIGTPDSWIGYVGNSWVVGILTLGALLELVTDQLPTTPSRKVPLQFGARIVSGAIAGAVIGVAGGVTIVGIIAGILGAIVGTLAGFAFRTSLALKLKNDHYAAFIEDGIAIALAFFILFILSK